MAVITTEKILHKKTGCYSSDQSRVQPILLLHFHKPYLNLDFIVANYLYTFYTYVILDADSAVCVQYNKLDVINDYKL